MPGEIFTNFWPYDDVEGQFKVTCVSCQRPKHAQDSCGVWQGCARKVTTTRYGCLAWFVSKDPAESCWDANGAANVTAKFKWSEAYRERCCSTTGPQVSRKSAPNETM